MVYAKYGSVFRKIREQKKMSLAVFQKVGISKPALSKFERGETMMGFENLVRALQEMGVTLSEYEDFLNAYSMGEGEVLLEEIENAVFLDDKQRLEELGQYTLENGFPVISMISKACCGKLDARSIEEITEYLYDVEIWGLSDLFLFYFTLEVLSIRDILHILKRFFPKGHVLFNSPKHRDVFLRITCRAVTVLIRRGYKPESKDILEQLLLHRLISTPFHHCLKRIVEGYWIYSFQSKKAGRLKVLDALQSLEIMSLPEVVLYYEKQYLHLIAI